MAMKLLIIDNYDSFTYILAQYFAELGAEPKVIKNDEWTLEQVQAFKPSHIVISPGPGSPDVAEDFGVCREVLEWSPVPVLGVCLGMQGMAWAAGARIVKAPQVMHGKRSEISHDGRGLFEGLASPLTVMRYHSLCVADLPDCFEVTAQSEDGVIQGIRHKEKAWMGIQFHPESIGTDYGLQMIENFLHTPVNEAQST